MLIAIIGGSGLNDPELIGNPETKLVSTRYGSPSSPPETGYLDGKQVCFLARHGKGHTISPTGINNRANITALKELGVTHIIATTAVGSLKSEIRTGDLVVPDQLIDFTKFRINTFEENESEEVRHVSLADPFDEELRQLLIQCVSGNNYQCHATGTLITIEGPRFSTRAESMMFRLWGADIINMSIGPEAALAREAGIPYAVLALSTDYDSWRTGEEPVSFESVMDVFRQNTNKVKSVLRDAIANFRTD
jgi:5'-methylthioadenosine phosphorylase